MYLHLSLICSYELSDIFHITLVFTSTDGMHIWSQVFVFLLLSQPQRRSLLLPTIHFVPLFRDFV